jgi:predicted dehydrogenase
LKRRDFIRSGSLLAGSALAMPITGMGTIFGDRVYNVGIIGYGDRGSGLHYIFNQLSDKFQVAAVCDVLDFRLENARKKWSGKKINFYSDYRKMLEDKSVDIVVVATPLNGHFEQGKAAIEAGKHLYIEKTMTFTADQALELVAIANRHPNQVIQVGHQYRYSPLYFKVKEMINNGYLGKVTQVDARWDRNHDWRRAVHSPELERMINWRMYREYSGGLAAELLSHQMDFIHWAFDCVPTTVYGTGGIDHFRDGRETFDNIQVSIRYANEGMIGSFGATCSNKHEGYHFKIKGTKGMVSLLMDEGIFYPEEETRAELEQVDGVSGATKLVWADDKSGVKILDKKTRDGSIYALEDFYRCLQENSLPHSNVFNGGRTAIAVALANKSMQDQSIENWKEGYNL